MAGEGRERRRMLDARIRRVLRCLDAEPDAERIAEYRALATEEHGSVLAALEADERDSKGRPGEVSRAKHLLRR